MKACSYGVGLCIIVVIGLLYNLAIYLPLLCKLGPFGPPIPMPFGPPISMPFGPYSMSFGPPITMPFGPLFLCPLVPYFYALWPPILIPWLPDIVILFYVS